MGIAENSSGWGPVSVPEEFEGMPFLPFGKNDKLNRIADWTAPSHQGRKQGDIQSAFSFSNEDDGSFTLVDDTNLQSKYSRTKRYGNQYNRSNRNWSSNRTAASSSSNAANVNARRARQQPRTGKRWRNNPIATTDTSRSVPT